MIVRGVLLGALIGLTILALLTITLWPGRHRRRVHATAGFRLPDPASPLSIYLATGGEDPVVIDRLAGLEPHPPKEHMQ